MVRNDLGVNPPGRPCTGQVTLRFIGKEVLEAKVKMPE
jgi:hypothetical protein